jgi:hypothetical protein
MRRPARGFLVGAAAAVLLAGCTSHVGIHPRPTAPGTSHSKTATSSLVDPTQYSTSIPDGVLLARSQGDGTAKLQGGEKTQTGDLVVAITCAGSGAVNLKDQTGGLLLGISSCKRNGMTIYSTRGRVKPSERELALDAPSTVKWRVAIWSAPRH